MHRFFVCRPGGHAGRCVDVDRAHGRRREARSERDHRRRGDADLHAPGYGRAQLRRLRQGVSDRSPGLHRGRVALRRRAHPVLDGLCPVRSLACATIRSNRSRTRRTSRRTCGGADSTRST